MISVHPIWELKVPLLTCYANTNFNFVIAGNSNPPLEKQATPHVDTTLQHEEAMGLSHRHDDYSTAEDAINEGI